MCERDAVKLNEIEFDARANTACSSHRSFFLSMQSECLSQCTLDKDNAHILFDHYRLSCAARLPTVSFSTASAALDQISFHYIRVFFFSIFHSTIDRSIQLLQNDCQCVTSYRVKCFNFIWFKNESE